MGYSVEVNSHTFATDVIEASYERPVLVDFFATWCGPCQMLKPVLERLVKEYDFVLAKIDIDQNPDLADRYGIEGVPDVRICTQGEMIPGFVGVLAEPQLRQFLSQLSLQSELEQALEEVQTLVSRSNFKEAKRLLDQLFQEYPQEPRVILSAARFLVNLNQFEDANQLLATIGEDQVPYFAQAQGVKALIWFKEEAENVGEGELDQRFAQGCRLTLAGEYEEALKVFLEILCTDRKYKQDGGRKAMLAIFQILGDEHPLTKEYRKQLMLQLY